MARRGPANITALLADIQRRPQVYFPALGRGSAGRTAQAATYLNYAPQFEALAALLNSASETRRTGVQSARRSGLGGSQGIQHIRDSYLEGLGQTLGDLGGPVATDAPARTPEARAAQGLGLSGIALAGMLSSMAAQQVAGIGNQTAQLNRQYSSAQDEIGSKLTGLFGQAGAYNTQQYETLAGQRRKERQAAQLAQERLNTQLMTAGIDPVTGMHSDALDPPSPSEQKTAADLKFFREHGYYPGRGKPGGAKSGKATPGTAGAATQADYKQYQTAYTQANRLVDLVLKAHPDWSDHKIASKILTSGVPVLDGDKTKFVSSDNQAAVWAAVQLRRHGGITRRTASLLHRNGLSVKRLGYKSWAGTPLAGR